MLTFLFFVGLVLLLVFILMATYSFKKKTGKAKAYYIISAISFAVMLFSFIGLVDESNAEQTNLSPESEAAITESQTPNKVNVSLENEVETSLASKLDASKVTPLNSRVTLNNSFKKNDRIASSLDLTLDQFIKNYNQVINMYNLNEYYQIDKVEVDTNGTNISVFNYSFNDNSDITGFINKSNGSLESIQIASSNPNTNDLNNLVILLVSMIDPALTKDQLITTSHQILQQLDSNSPTATFSKRGYDYSTRRWEDRLALSISKPVY